MAHLCSGVLARYAIVVFTVPPTPRFVWGSQAVHQVSKTNQREKAKRRVSKRTKCDDASGDDDSDSELGGQGQDVGNADI